MHDEFAAYGVRFYAINSPAFGENATTLDAFKIQAGLSYPVLTDQSTEFLIKFTGSNSFPYPRDVVVDANGVIRHAGTDYNGQATRAMVIELLQEAGLPTP